MKITLQVEKEFEVKELHVKANVRYWDDAEVNGIKDIEGDLIPCREGELWSPIIDIETGIIKNWELGKTADIHYKVCDEGTYTLVDDKGESIRSTNGYVIDCLSIGESGYGDYIILSIDETGKIQDWNPDFEDLIELSQE